MINSYNRKIIVNKKLIRGGLVYLYKIIENRNNYINKDYEMASFSTSIFS